MLIIKKTNIIILSFLIFFIIISRVTALDLIFLGSIGEMYDDNTNLSSENPESDYITNLMLGFGINLEGRTQTLRLLGHTYQQLYYRQNELNNNAQDITLNYRKEFTSRDRFTLNDTFGHYPEPQQFQDMFGQPQGRNGYYNNTLNLTFDKDLLTDFSINLHYNNIITRSTSEAINDSISNGAGLILNYAFNAFNILSLLYDYNNTRYESADEDDEEDNIQHIAGLRYQHYFTRQLSFSASGGVEYVESRDVSQYNPHFTLSLINDIDENNIINISISKRTQTTLLTNEVYESWIFSALFTRQVSDRSRFSLSAFYQYGKIVSSLNETESRLFGINTYGNYYLNENIFISARYIYTRTTNKYIRPASYESEYDRNQIELSANAQY